MLNPLDTKQSWLGVQVETDSDKVFSKEQLIKKSEQEDVFVFGFASSWSGVSEKDKSQAPPAKKQRTESAKDAGGTGGGTTESFIQVPWSFMKDFELYFYGTVGLDGAGNSVPLVTDNSGSTSLPWHLFSKGWDNLMNSEMPCMAFVLPQVKKTKSGKADKIKTKQFMSGEASVADPKAKSKAKEDTAGTATTSQQLAEQVLLGKAAKRKAKAKASSKSKKNDQVLSDAIIFIEAPLFLGFLCGVLCGETFYKLSLHAFRSFSLW